jgi:hypothetical protein
MFAEARDSDMDLEALGEQMAARKAELEAASTAKPGARRGRDGSRASASGSR